MARGEEFGVRQYFMSTPCTGRWHMQNVELVYVLEGSVRIKVSEREYLLKKEDILVMNAGATRGTQLLEEAFLCVLEIDAEKLAKEIGRDKVLFWCNCAEDPEGDYKKLRELLGKLLVECSVNLDQMSLRKKSLFYRILDVLLNRYVIESKTRMELAGEDQAFRQILSYIRKNYWKQLSLSEVAEKAYMTSSAFSRYFKKNAGINFLEYLNNLRLQNALEDLLYSKKPLTHIAMDHGFTNPSMFSRAFRAAYGMAPSDYKKAKQSPSPEPDSGREVQEDCRDRLKRFVAEKENRQEEGIFTRHIRSGVQEGRPYEKVWNQAINVGSASDLRSAKMQEHVLELKRDLGFCYVRIQNILGRDMLFRQDHTNSHFNFEVIDEVLDFLVSHQLHPFVDFGDKPKRAFERIGKATFWQEEEPLFESLEESRVVFDVFLRHIVNRYGTEEVERWIFENWYDPRADRRGSYDYIEVFSMVSDCVHRYAPKARVGGAGLELGNIDDAFLEDWSRSSTRPDFFSVVAFPYKRRLPGFEVVEDMAERATDFLFLQNETRKLRQRLTELGFGDLPLVFSEWNLSMADRNFYNDSCGKAAQMLANMVALQGAVSLGAYLYGTDLNIRYYDTGAAFFGGTGLLSKDGLPKPAYYALRFLQNQGNRLLQGGDGYLLTAAGKNDWYLLLYYYKRFHFNYFSRTEDQIQMDDLPYCFADQEAMEYEVELSGFTPGSYDLKTYRIGQEHGSVLNNWQRLGGIRELDAKEKKYLKQISIPYVEIRQTQSEDGTLCFSERLSAGEICYVHIYSRK